MLVLSRRENERVVLPSVNTSIQVVRITGSTVRLGIDAPDDVPVFREELLRKTEADTPAENGSKAPRTTRSPRKPQETEPGGRASRLEQYEKLLDCLALALDLTETHLTQGKIAEARETLLKAREHLRRACAQQPLVKLGPTAASGHRVALVIEPVQCRSNSLSRVLQKAGHTVLSFASGCRAIDYLATHARPNLIVINRPEKRHCVADTIRTIRQNPALNGVKLVALSDSQPAEVQISIGPQGVDYWFASQTRPETILQVIEA
ncbi:MAG: carbon storage regulator [Thermogutta sp.]